MDFGRKGLIDRFSTCFFFFFWLRSGGQGRAGEGWYRGKMGESALEEKQKLLEQANALSETKPEEAEESYSRVLAVTNENPTDETTKLEEQAINGKRKSLNRVFGAAGGGIGIVRSTIRSRISSTTTASNARTRGSG